MRKILAFLRIISAR